MCNPRSLCLNTDLKPLPWFVLLRRMGPFAAASEDVVPAGTYTLIPNTILMDNRGHCHLSLDASEDKRMVQVCARTLSMLSVQSCKCAGQI